MYVRRDIEPKIIWHFSWLPVSIFTAISLCVYLLYTQMKIAWLAIPFLPVTTIGTAVAFYVGFKNNASYERLWEARKIWAEIEHLSRFWAMLVLKTKGRTKFSRAEELRRELIYRHLAWINCLRIQLRHRKMFLDEESHNLSQVKIVQHQAELHDFEMEIAKVLQQFTSEEELAQLRNKRNVAVELLSLQLRALEALQDDVIEPDYAKLVDTIGSCSQQQAAAERIGSFPFPRQYAYMSTLFVNIFVVLLPFSLIGELYKTDAGMAWLTVPFSVLIAWVFHTMEKVGEESSSLVLTD